MTKKRNLKMKRTRLFLLAAIAVFVFGLGACNHAETPTDFEPVYKLFPTKNIWTFIKLNTRNGLMWQVQFTVSNDGSRFETPLNADKLVGADEEKDGRFTLYSTENIYNLILLDQINGKTWQVQWSGETENRVVLPITDALLK
jgi:hypothetical protein